MSEAVERYKEENRGKTLLEVVEDIKAFVLDYGLQGRVQVSDFHDTVYVRVEKAWAVGADLTINFNGGVRGDWKMEPCDIGWSSTKRTIPEAVAAINLYRELVDLGSLVEAKFSKEKIIAFDDNEILEIIKSEQEI